MAFGQIDPARLEGDALRRWYQRSSWDIYREKREVEAQQWKEYAAATRRELLASQRDQIDRKPETADGAGGVLTANLRRESEHRAASGGPSVATGDVPAALGDGLGTMGQTRKPHPLIPLPSDRRPGSIPSADTLHAARKFDQRQKWILSLTNVRGG